MEEIKRIPGIHQHNTFAKLIEQIYKDDFTYDNHWRMKENEYKEIISSTKFRIIIFDKQGKLAKYILDEITRESLEVLNSRRGFEVDYEELERLINIYQSLFKNEIKRGKIVLKENVEKFFI